MPWNESTVYEQRVRFVLEVEQKTFSFSESCKRYGVSRTAGYRWWNRHQALGLEGSTIGPTGPIDAPMRHPPRSKSTSSSSVGDTGGDHGSSVSSLSIISVTPQLVAPSTGSWSAMTSSQPDADGPRSGLTRASH